MADDFAEYATYFKVGLRVEIGFYVSGSDTFREWGVVNSYQDDVIQVFLSREHLPKNIRLEVSTIVDVGVWVNQEVYSCRAIVVTLGEDKSLWLRLITSMTLKERRQFYRLDTNLRVRYSLPVIRELEDIKSEWVVRRRLARMNLLDTSEKKKPSDEFNSRWLKSKYASREIPWHECAETRASVGGGGIRFKIKGKLNPDSLVNLELHLPNEPPVVVHTVAEVIYTLNPLVETGSAEASYLTGMKFLYIDERDRDEVIKYISIAQLEDLRKISERKHLGEEVTFERYPLTLKQIFIRGVLLTILIILTGYLIYNKKAGRDPSVIQDTYQNQIMKFRGN